MTIDLFPNYMLESKKTHLKRYAIQARDNATACRIVADVFKTAGYPTKKIDKRIQARLDEAMKGYNTKAVYHVSENYGSKTKYIYFYNLYRNRQTTYIEGLPQLLKGDNVTIDIEKIYTHGYEITTKTETADTLMATATKSDIEADDRFDDLKKFDSIAKEINRRYAEIDHLLETETNGYLDAVFEIRPL